MGKRQNTLVYCLAQRSRNCYRLLVIFSSFSFHSLSFFASVIQLLLFMRSYFLSSFVSPVLLSSLMSSSHLLSGLPTNLLVLILLSRPGCQLKILLVHLSFGRNAILLAIRHFILLCVSIQKGIFIFFIYSSASLVLLLMYSIHSSSFPVMSISSSLSSWTDTSLSWSLLELCSEPSSVSL